MEWAKLAVGLLLALFHERVADYILHQERTLVILLRQRGLMVPGVVTQRFAYNVYFILGIFVASYQIIRIWVLMHP